MAYEYKVSPTEPRPTHDLLLTDSTGAKVGLTLCQTDGTIDPNAILGGPLPTSGIQMYQGSQQYTDTPPPWSPISMDDWSSGRGSRNFDRDASKYNDGFRVNTTRRNELILSPWDNWATGIHAGDQYWRGAFGTTGTRTSTNIGSGAAFEVTYVAIPFLASSSYTTGSVWFIAANMINASNLTVAIYNDDSDKPGSSLTSNEVGAITDPLQAACYKTMIARFSTALTSGTKYWLVFYHPSINGSTWEILGTTGAGTKKFKGNLDPYKNWGAAPDGYLYYRINPAEKPFRTHFVNYKGNVFAALQYDDGSASKLFINGDQGCATGGTTTTLVDTAKSWADDSFDTAIVKLNEGAGSEQDTNWALITDTTAATKTITFDELDVAPAANSIYSIIGASSFREIDTTAATPNWDDPSTAGTVKSALSVNHGILFAMGDGFNGARYRARNSAGTTWAEEWIAETECKFSKLIDAKDVRGSYIWGAKGGYPAQINYASARDWSGTGAHSTVLDFQDTAINCGDVGEKITGITKYGEYGNLHVLKEGSIYQVVDSSGEKLPLQLGLAQYGNSRDMRNGQAAVGHNVYLYFTYHNTLLRYFNGQVDNVGPTRDDEGLPADRLGSISALVGYENMVIAAFDGGKDNYSCIMAYNGVGWCEWFRSPEKGMRIRSLHVEALPGDNVDRLWFDCGSDIGWLPLDSDPSNFPIINDYHYYVYAQSGYLITPYIYFNKQNSRKLFNKLSIVFENYSTSYIYSYPFYRIDGDTDWKSLTSIYDIAQFSTAASAFSSTYNIIGKRIQLAFLINTFEQEKTPRIVAAILEALIQQDSKNYLDITFRIADKDVDLQGNLDPYKTISEKYNKLLEFAQSPAGLLVNTRLSVNNGKYYKLDSMSLRVLNRVSRENRNYIVARARLFQLSD